MVSAKKIALCLAVAAAAPSVLAAEQRRLGARAADGGSYVDDARKSEKVNSLLKAKFDANQTFDEIAEKTGLTNVYVGQLFHQQAQLKPDTAQKLKAVVPTLTDDQIAVMQKAPFRSYDEIIKTEPSIFRFTEALLHHGQSIKEVINEKFGDGIMSAIDMYVNVQKVKGGHGEDRVLITLNGKYLAFNEQIANY